MSRRLSPRRNVDSARPVRRGLTGDSKGVTFTVVWPAPGSAPSAAATARQLRPDGSLDHPEAQATAMGLSSCPPCRRPCDRGRTSFAAGVQQLRIRGDKQVSVVRALIAHEVIAVPR